MASVRVSSTALRSCSHLISASRRTRPASFQKVRSAGSQFTRQASTDVEDTPTNQASVDADATPPQTDAAPVTHRWHRQQETASHLTHRTLCGRWKLPPPDKLIRTTGHVRSIRKQKTVAFAQLADGSQYQSIQAVLSPEQARDIHNGCFIEVSGKWKDSLGGGQKKEFVVIEVAKIYENDVEASPLQKKEMSHEHLRRNPHMRLQVPAYSLMARTRSFMIDNIHKFFNPVAEFGGATYVQPPIITSSDCEGAGEVFTISPKAGPVNGDPATSGKQQSYFREQKYLTVSSQLHLEAYAAELGDVWTLTPAFRAEQSDTNRHLAEFWMLEYESRDSFSGRDLQARIQSLLQFLVRNLQNSTIGDDLKQWSADMQSTQNEDSKINLEARWSAVLDLWGKRWMTIRYTDAVDRLMKAADEDPKLFKEAPTWKGGLAFEHEKWLVEHVAENRPLFVHSYPQDQKPFYMREGTSPEDRLKGRRTVRCFDLLMPFGIGEVVGGSVREHRLQVLIENMRRKKMLTPSPQQNKGEIEAQKKEEEAFPFLIPGESLGSLKWYAELRRFGSMPHGGFGLGFERLLMYLTGIDHVRDIVPFPRTFRNCIA